jgi:hypothetical protein
MHFERDGQRLKERCERVVLGVSKSKSKSELALTTHGQFSSERNVTVSCMVELPVHLKVAS